MDVVNKLLLAFVTLILGLVLIGTIATSVIGVSSGTQVINETQAIGIAMDAGTVETNVAFNVTNAPTGWKTEDCPLTGIAIKNATNAALTRDTDYTFYPTNGSWTLKGTTVNTSKFWANNNSYVSYTYCGNDYLNSSWGRSVLNISVGMFAIALLVASVALFYSVAQEAGIM
jgi:hypothetical protein